MKRKLSQSFVALLILVSSIQSCVIEEHYHFSKDLSGQYEMTFDLGKFAERDSTGEMMQGVIDGILEETANLENIMGISEISSNQEGSIANLSFEFSGVDALNKVENLDSEGKNQDFFRYKKGTLSISPNLDDVKNSAKKDKADADVGEMLSTMIQYKVKVTFDEEMDVKKMKGFNQLDNRTFLYDSETQGWDNAPSLKVKEK